MIRRHIVVGLRDVTLSEKLQMDPKLMLDKAVSISRESETIKKQQPLLQGHGAEEQTVEVGMVQRHRLIRQGASTGWQSMGRPIKLRSTPAKNGSCSRCGHSPLHDQHKCPVYAQLNYEWCTRLAIDSTRACITTMK